MMKPDHVLMSACAFLACALVAAPARGQDEGGEAPAAPEGASEAAPAGDDEGAEPAEGAEGGTPEVPVARPGGVTAGGEGGAAQPQVSEIHVVNQGDTIWDLCAKYLNSPWYWPKIWSYNPHITNPNWIYPGNELRFYPSDENLPTNVQVSQAMTMGEKGEELDIPEALDVEDMVRTIGTVQTGGASGDSIYTAHVAFMSEAEHAVAGQIQSAQAESQLLIDFERVYVKLKSAAKKGETYAIYRTIKEIEHPVSGEAYGYAVEIIGGLTIIDTSPAVATAEINQAYRPIERGDFVGQWPENIGTRVRTAPNETDAQGYIIDTMESALSEIGEHHVVFIDRGRSHGVQLGNVFTVVQRGDGFTRETSGLPNEELGRLMVIDVQDKSATAMIISSSREIEIGDKIEMRKSM